MNYTCGRRWTGHLYLLQTIFLTSLLDPVSFCRSSSTTWSSTELTFDNWYSIDKWQVSYLFTGSTTQTNETLQYHYICPKNFENVGRKCYYFSNGTGTWFQAYFNCKDFGGSNFTIFTDKYDQRQLEQFLFRGKGRSRGMYVFFLHSEVKVHP